jgi:hypothetical protein
MRRLQNQFDLLAAYLSSPYWCVCVCVCNALCRVRLAYYA